MIYFGDEFYNDFIDLDVKIFYECIKKELDNIFKISYVVLGYMLNIFDKFYKEGFIDVLVIVIVKLFLGFYDVIV